MTFTGGRGTGINALRDAGAVFSLFTLLPLVAAAQPPPATLDISVRADNRPVPAADVVVAGETWTTDEAGSVVVRTPAGPVTIVVVKTGFLPLTVSATLEAGEVRELSVDLIEPPGIEEEVIVVAATRTNTRLADQPIRVEVLDRDEIEEKILMTPGDIVMLLNETGGLRVQATAPAMGAASVRIQGMRGRHTRFLSDGLPLFGPQVAGLGLLQVPPMDLGQVEVIKGVASALYGAGAIGGVVNLTSRRPGPEPERELLVNRTSRGGTDTVAWLATPLSETWSMSLLGSGHWHDRTDVDDDPWADLAGYARGVVRPRVYWDGGNGRQLFVTVGTTYEERTGGTRPGAVLAQTGEPYREALDTRRVDGGVVGQFLVADRYVATARFAAVEQHHTHQFGDVRERDRHHNLFAELAVRGGAAHHTWVAGVALERDLYEPRDVPRFRYDHRVPGVFIQDDIELAPWLSISASGRLDLHSEYGPFFSPRLSGLLRMRGWSSRVSVGTGFFAPTPLTEETEAAGLTRLQIPGALEAERGRSASIDLSRDLGPVTATVTMFGARVLDPVEVDRNDRFALINLLKPTTTTGVELLGTLGREPFAVTTSYAYVRARETAEGNRQDVALTPRHSVGVVGMWEAEDHGRIGVELFYTGAQRVEENPFRDYTEPYVVAGLLVERRVGRVRIFFNAENVTDVRQTRWDPLIRPTRGADGRWTVDAWAPLEGRVINGGVRWDF